MILRAGKNPNPKDVPKQTPKTRHDQHRWSAKLQNGLWYFDLIESMVCFDNKKTRRVCSMGQMGLPNIVLFSKKKIAWIEHEQVYASRVFLKILI